MLNLFQHGSFSPSLLKKQGDFSVVLTGSNGACGRDLLAEDLVLLQEVKLIKLWGPQYDWVCLEFLSVSRVHSEPLAICQLEIKFSYWFSRWVGCYGKL
jgi:hypothetical protein